MVLICCITLLYCHFVFYRWAYLAMNTVANPVPMKVTVATKERSERRPSPHTPWPLVQPEPITVPKPTSKPASAKVLQG